MPFGAYLLLKRIAVGGMAELFLARDTRNGKLVVLKRILPYLAEEAEFVRMFLDEARIAAALHHPSIVELYELGHLEGSTFIAMEWVDGIDLRKILQKEQEKGGAVPVGVAAYLVARLCEGLQHAHFARDAEGKAMGIIHRDVSPQNVMVSYDGGVKLVDFGIAKATAWMSRSKPGVIKGKFLYLAPEQLTTDPLDHRTDLFALGTLLYELTTGQSPFLRTSTEAVIYSIRMENPDPPERLKPGFPVALAAIIDHCLVKDRDQRYQTAGEIAADLEEFLRTEAPTSRADVVQYVASLFGDSSERTSIYIPPNAQARKDSRTDTSTQRDGPFDSLAEEHTVPLAPPARSALPEGRRETGEIDAPPTDPTKPERPRPRPPPKNPWGTPEETAPMAQPPKPVRAAEPAAKRDLQATADLEHQAPLGEAGIGPTTVSTSGARDVEVGQVFAPMVPTMLGESAPSLRPAVPRLASPAARPAPPVPSSEDLPEVGEHSVVSAGEATIGADPVERRAAEEEPSEPSDPVPDAPSTRAPPRRNAAPVKAPKPVKRRPVPESDPDDLIATVDQANEFSTRGRLPRRGVLWLALGVGAAALLVLLSVLLWPSSPVEAPGKPPPPKEAPKVATEPPPPPEPKRVRVQISAVAGTTLSVDGKAVEPNGILERAPGEIVVKFTCPAKKKKGAQPSSLRATIPESGGLFSVPVPCP